MVAMAPGRAWTAQELVSDSHAPFRVCRRQALAMLVLGYPWPLCAATRNLAFVLIKGPLHSLRAKFASIECLTSLIPASQKQKSHHHCNHMSAITMR
jgi:hypothetical protein